MIKMSFFNGTLNKEEAIAQIKNSDKPCVYTIGFAYKNPTTYRRPKTTEEAIDIIEKSSLLDITEEAEVFHLNVFSENDMY